jgi:DNA polymerase III subunit beta
MKFKVTKAELLEGLQIVQNVVGGRTTLPILSNVLLLAEKKKLWMTTTDLDMTVRCSVDIDATKTGSTTLPAKRLSSIVRELPDSTVEVEVDEKNAATVRCNSSFFKIFGLSEEEFPPPPKAEGKYCYHIDQGVFKEMLRKTSYAASTDETRYVLNGVLLSFKDGKLTMVATDGRRLALVEQEVEVPKEAEVEAILPSKVVNELIHILLDEGQMNCFITENQVIFEAGDMMIASKLIEGTYPNYRQVIPAQCEERVAVERESILTAAKRVSLLATDKSNAMKMTLGKNQITLSMSTPEVGEARETVPVKYSGKEISIAFNPDYIMEPLRTLANDEVFFELTDELSPGVLKCDIPFLYVLMPMRIT